MPYIKKLVMKGFKSFARETEIPMINGMNVVVGPNGSGKSNITDSICFVLGRMSSKSMRAEKISNLIFAGTKDLKPASEASVKLVFDNADRKLEHEANEVAVERVVRRSGQSLYKINNEIKTRQEVLELLASGGIDPYGFNLVLQGEITGMIKAHPEERRKIIEEVAGISIYEVRKEKSIKELEKTDERLKEAGAILRERKAYLKNLEEERKQALKFRELEQDVKNFKASILQKKLEEKNKDIKKSEEDLAKIQGSKDKIKLEIEKIQQEITSLEEEIASLNSYMQRSSGLEQEQINDDISNLKANLATLTVKRDSNETRLKELLNKRSRAEEDIKILEREILELRKNSPLQAQKHKELEEKKKQLETVEKERKELYNFKEKLNSIKALINEKDKRSQKVKNEYDFLIRESERIAQELNYKDIEVCKKSLEEMKSELEKTLKNIEKFDLEKTELEKSLSVFNMEISNNEKIKGQVSSLDICPLCKNKITPEHISHVTSDCNDKIKGFSEKLEESAKNLEKLKNESISTKIRREVLQKDIPKAEINLIKLKNLEEKKVQIKNLSTDEKSLDSEKKELEKNKLVLENKILQVKEIEERYDKLILEIQEISSRTEQHLDIDLEMKERDLEKTRIIIKQSFRDEEDLTSELKELKQSLDEKQKLLEIKEGEEKTLKEKFQKIIEKRDILQKGLKEKNSSFNEKQITLSQIDGNLNNLKIEKARLNAEREGFEIDLKSYPDSQIVPGSIISLQERFEKAQHTLSTIGSVNLRALEVYDSIKSEYDAIEQKVLTLESEKQEILNIISEIDTKKKRTFMKTLYAVNEIFKRNFMQLSTKGEAFLELENTEDPFSAGLNVTIRVGKGKYFDITSLSGGEQTLVALSLIFAIQEHKPYSFYIFDEVDAALDKRNSEKLAGLVKRYMKAGQYIIVTHNDALITASTVLYGISMQEGISKVISLEI